MKVYSKKEMETLAFKSFLKLRDGLPKDVGHVAYKQFVQEFIIQMVEQMVPIHEDKMVMVGDVTVSWK